MINTSLSVHRVARRRPQSSGFKAPAWPILHLGQLKHDEEPWLGDAKGGELVFAAELRNALFDALGVFRWVWW